MKLRDKATTLKHLKIKSANIPKIISFEVDKYKKNKNFYLKLIKKKIKNVAVRSANYSEDRKDRSSAGKFLSFLNIKSKNTKELDKKILKVINSYKYHNHKKNKILIQKMVENITFSGVATSCDKNDRSPYYVINLSKSKDSTIITSGKNKLNETFYLYNKSPLKAPHKISKIKSLIDELKIKLKENSLDIEFAVDKNNKLYLLQVRKLITNKNKIIYADDAKFNHHLDKLYKKIKKIRNRNYALLGKTTYFGIMPDWNPAEIIGRRPNPLAFSLYKELITDTTWATQRKDYGYRNLENYGLLSSFFGMPYVDVRLDFNSWIPASLDKNIAEKLTNYYLEKFKDNPTFHDKIEFKIVFTCFSTSNKKKIFKLPNKIFSYTDKQKIINALKEINKITFIKLKEDSKKIEILENKIKSISNSKTYFLDKIYWLIEDCKKYGTLPFAGLARCGFVGTELLNSLVEEKIISEKDKEKFLKSIKTIAFDLNNDFFNKDKKNFIKRYGHLRPNTYEVDTLNYKEGYHTYFNKSKKENIKLKYKKFIFSEKNLNAINKLLKKNNLSIDAQNLIDFIKKSIQLREYSKFVFTKSIDQIFYNLKALFKRLNISKNDIKFLSIQTIKNLFYSLDHDDLKETFLKEISKLKLQFYKNRFIKLPANIFHENDIYCFKLEKDEPNFISNKNVISDIYNLTNFVKSKHYENKIICIENADPGYDFLFSYKIKGLITKYGGVNSHMAIRCNELGIAAAIGVGEKIFSNLINSNKVQLNCQNKTIKIF